jgi:hypothetical protein
VQPRANWRNLDPEHESRMYRSVRADVQGSWDALRYQTYSTSRLRAHESEQPFSCAEEMLMFATIPLLDPSQDRLFLHDTLTLRSKSGR